MKQWIAKKLIELLNSAQQEQRKTVPEPGLVSNHIGTQQPDIHERVSGNGQPTYRLTLVKAMNGRVLEVGLFKPNAYGPDWRYELYIIDADERVSDAIAKVLAIKALEN